MGINIFAECFFDENIFLKLETNKTTSFLKCLFFVFVEENSLKEWSFKKAITIETYSTYHPIPVPFNLISHLFLWIKWLCCLCRRCKRQPREKPLSKRSHVSRFKVIYLVYYQIIIERQIRCCTQLDLEMEFNQDQLSTVMPTGLFNADWIFSNLSWQKKSLDDVVENLQFTYFSCHGYSFPLTGKDNSEFTQQHSRKKRTAKHCDKRDRAIRPVSNVVLLPSRTQLIELNSTLAQQ